VALISDEPKTSEELGIFVILENDDEVTWKPAISGFVILSFLIFWTETLRILFLKLK